MSSPSSEGSGAEEEPKGLRAIFSMKREELPFALLMFGYFFLVITSFWILKPVKKSLFIEFYDESGVEILGALPQEIDVSTDAFGALRADCTFGSGSWMASGDEYTWSGSRYQALATKGTF